MFKRILTYLFLFSTICFSQTGKINSNQAKQLYSEATDNFFNLETKKSVKKAERVLIYALRSNDKI